MRKVNDKKSQMKIALIGLGGTGTHILDKIYRLPVNICVIDRDIVEENNLNRQFIFTKGDIGKPKVLSIPKQINKKGNIVGVVEDLTNENISSLLEGSDIIIECTDNVISRLIINDYCKKYNLPWISTSAILNFGQAISIPAIDKKQKLSIDDVYGEIPCYQCALGEKFGDTCNHSNVELEVLDKISLFVKSLVSELLNSGKLKHGFWRFNSNSSEIKLLLRKNPSCQACKGNFLYLNGERTRLPKALCGNKHFMFNVGKLLDLSKLKSRIKGVRKSTSKFIITDDMTILSTGRIIVKAKDQKDARKKFDKELSI